MLPWETRRTLPLFGPGRSARPGGRAEQEDGGENNEGEGATAKHGGASSCDHRLVDTPFLLLPLGCERGQERRVGRGTLCRGVSVRDR